MSSTEPLALPDAPRCILTGNRAVPGSLFDHRLTNFCRSVENKLKCRDEEGLAELAKGVPADYWEVIFQHARDTVGVVAPTPTSALAPTPTAALPAAVIEEPPAAVIEEPPVAAVEEAFRRTKRGR